MFSRNQLESRLNTICRRPENNTISQERHHEINLNSDNDYVRDPDQLMDLWEQIGKFTEMHPEIKTWDDAMAKNPDWYNFKDPRNKKLSVFFNYRRSGNMPESIKDIIQRLSSSCSGKDFMSILNDLIEQILKFEISCEPKFNKKIFDNDFKYVDTQRFFFLHYRSLSKINRINWLNGAWQYFVNLLESFFGPSFTDFKRLKNVLCTENNYYEFAEAFDTSVWQMRSLKQIQPMTTNMRDKINKLWSATFFFWCCSDEFQNKPNHKYYPFFMSDDSRQLYEQRIRENMELE